MTKPVPTLYEWMGGAPAIEKLLAMFYARVPSDPILAPVFAGMSPDHVKHVAAFVGEVFGGPKAYSGEGGVHPQGGHGHMIRRHANRSLDDTQRKRWIAMLLEAADELGVPDDPEFRSAFVAISNGERVSPSSIRSRAQTSAARLRCRLGAGVR